MSRRPRRWPIAWPMPPLSMLLPAAAVAAAVGFGVLDLLDLPVEWPRTSAAFHELLLLAGPIAATAAYFYCASLSGRHSLLALASAPRAGPPSVLRSFAVVLASMVAAYLVPLVPLAVHTAATATYGSFDVLAALAGPTGLALAVAVGCALGTVLSRPVLAPGVGVLVFLLFQLPNITLPAAAAFVPTLGSPVTVGVFENPAFVVYRLVTMGVLAALVLGAAAMVARGARGRELVTLRSGIAALAATVLVAMPLVNPPNAVRADEAPPRVCEQVGTVDVCLHQGHRELLGQAVPVVRALVEAYGKPPVHLRAVYGSELLLATAEPSTTTAPVTPYTTGPFEDLVADRVAYHLAGRTACLATDPSGLRYEEVAGRVNTLATWLRRTAGLADPRLPPAAGDFLGGAGTAEVRAWIAEYERALATCQPVPEAG